jgi:predicted N-acetyltransferase YhbS
VPLDRRYRIERAAPEHLRLLPGIERAAAAQFAGHGLDSAALEEQTAEEDFREAQRHGLLWVALDAGGRPVGFALADSLDGALHLEEIDVHPEHGRRGLGSALVRAVCDQARESGLPAVTLTTFRDIPWNAPFYARLGFRAVESQRLSPLLAERMREEAARGLELERRVSMRFETGVD